MTTIPLTHRGTNYEINLRMDGSTEIIKRLQAHPRISGTVVDFDELEPELQELIYERLYGR